MSEPPRRLELHLSYSCGQRCAFCSESARMARWRAQPPRGREVSAALLEHRRAVGSPLLPAALALARRLGLRTYVTSNGGLFADPAYARRVLPWLDELCLSVHGPDAETHDACAGVPGSFSRLMRAFESVERFGARTYLLTNTVATTRNWDRLEDTLRLLASRDRVRHALVSNPAPEGRAAAAYRALAVPLARWRERVPALVKAFEGRPTVVRFFGLPLCVLAGFEEHSNDLHFSPRVTVERRSALGRPALAAVVSRDASRGRSKPEACRECSAGGACAGVFDRYLDAFGGGELAARARRP